MKKLITTLLTLFIALLPEMHAQDITFRHLTTDNGLSQFSVNDLYKDEQGFIWIGTREGLNRYNGNNIKTFKLQKEDSTSLFCNNIFHITGNQQGKIYLLCTEGVSELDLKKETFKTLLEGHITAIHFNKHLYIGKRNEIHIYNEERRHFELFYQMPENNAIISYLQIDNQGTIWIGTSNKGIYTLEGKNRLKHLISKGNITSIYEDSLNNIWIGSWENGLFCVSKGIVTNYLNNPKDNRSISSNFVRAMCEDNQGNMWFGTFHGLNKMDRETGEFKNYVSVDKPGALTHSSIWCIIKDHQGTLWAGTYFGGVNYFNPEYEIYTQYRTSVNEKEGLSSPIVGRMTEDENNNLWICTEGGGVNVYNRKDKTFTWYKQSSAHNSISHDNVKAIYYDKTKEIMWIGTHLGGLNRLDIKTNRFTHYRHMEGDSTTIPSDIVRDIVPYKDQLIIATQQGVCQFDPQTGKAKQLFKDSKIGRSIMMVADLLFDHQGTLWIAASGEGVFSYRFDKHKLTNYRHRSGLSNSLSSNNINSMTLDASQRLWFATSGTGLDLYHNENDSFENFDSQKNGLSGDCVYQVCSSHKDKLLVITNQGFSQFDCTNKIFHNFNIENGFPLTAINENALYLAQDGEVFLGGIQGMVSFNESELNFTPKPYNIVLYRLLVNGKEIKVGDETNILNNTLGNTAQITLSSDQSVFDIEFATSNFIPANKNEIVYKLEGFSDTWNNTRGQHNITYTNLNAGIYTLIIKSNSLDASLMAETRLIIEILPPFYKTTYAYLMYMLIIIILFYYLIKTYNGKIKLQESLKYEQKHIQDIEELNQSKLRFFTNISHEFRTPLTLIVGQVEMLLQVQSFTPSIYNKVLGVYKNSLQLRELITELLDFRKQEQGHMKIKVSSHNLVSFLYENFLIFMEYGSTKLININFEKEEENIEAWFDLKQMQKVINNLLSNALKHSKEGDTITIRVKKAHDNVIIEIADTGTGIDAAEVDKIFDRFYQTEKLDSLSAQGTGIGLALTKGIIELHHGTIKVSSELGKGSLFIITLKQGKGHFEKEQINEHDPTSQDTTIKNSETAFSLEQKELDEGVHERIKGTKMLIVEDNDSLREMLVNIFEPLYDISTAKDGKEGLEKVKNELPQIVLSDVVMPNMSGTELCKCIKNEFETCHIPVVLLTARTAIEHNIEGLRLGADDYITKPFNVNILISRCNNLVNSRIILQEKFSRQPQASSQMLATNPLDKQLLDKAMEIIEKYMDDAEFNINFFAREMGIARTNLFAKIKGITGQTPNDFISSMRLKKAALMLRNNLELNISEISDRTGFSSSRYFSKCFKDIYHVSPLSYRRGTNEEEEE